MESKSLRYSIILEPEPFSGVPVLCGLAGLGVGFAQLLRIGLGSKRGGSPVETFILNSLALKVTLSSEWYVSQPNSTKPSRASADTSSLTKRY